jgi:hypothetical protein
MRKIHATSSTTTWRVSSIITVMVRVMWTRLSGRLLLLPLTAPLLLTLHLLQPLNIITLDKFHEVGMEWW